MKTKEEKAEYDKRYWSIPKNKKRKIENSKKYYKKNKKKICDYRKKYDEKNKEKVAEVHKLWRIKNKGIIAKKRQENYLINKDKIRKKQKVYYEKNKHREDFKERDRRAVYRRKYRITIKEYNLMLKAQNNKCKICDKVFEKKNKKGKFRKKRYEIIDHNHYTGKVRGLLCSNCNNILGLSYENKDILNNVIDYLNQNN